MAKHYLFLDNDGDKALSVGGRIFGSDGAQTVQLLEHAAPAVIANSVERVEFATDVAGYKFKGLGTKVEIYKADGVTKVAEVAIQKEGTQFSFKNGTVKVVADKGTVSVGGVELPKGNDVAPGPVVPAVIDTADVSTVPAGGSAPGPAPSVPGNQVLPTVDGKTFEFKAKVDDDLKGTEQNDKFVGVTASKSKERTLEADDKVDGGAGKDILSVTLEKDFKGFKEGAFKDVEFVELKAKEGLAGVKFSAQNMKGVEQYNIEGNVSLQKVADKAHVDLKSVNADVEIDFAGKDAAMTLRGVAKTLPGAVKLTTGKAENLTLDVRGPKNNVEIGAKNMVVRGDGNLEFTSTNKLSTFDSSEATGAMNLHLNTANKLEKVTTGAGNDVIELSPAANVQSISTGAGDDYVKIGSLDQVLKGIDMGSGKDTLDLGTLGGTLIPEGAFKGVTTLAVDPGANLTVINEENALADLEALTVNDLKNDIAMYELGERDMAVTVKDITANKTLSLDHSGKTTVQTAKGAAGASTMVLKLNASTDLSLTMNNANNKMGVVGVSLQNIEVTAGANIAAANLKFLAGESAETLKLHAQKGTIHLNDIVMRGLKTIEIDGYKDVQLENTNNFQFSDDLTVNAESLKANLTFKGGNDSITINGPKYFESDVTITDGRNTSEINVTTGLQDDKLKFDKADLGLGDVTADMGLGEDKITISQATTVNNLTLKGVEDVDVTNDLTIKEDLSIEGRTLFSLAANKTMKIGGDITGIENVTFQGNANSKFELDNVNSFRDSMVFGGNANAELHFNGTANADTIDLSNVSEGALIAGKVFVQAGKGNDTITCSSHNDTIKFETAADNGVDTINGFTAGANKDKLDFSASATFLNAAAAALKEIEDATTAGAANDNILILKKDFKTYDSLAALNADTALDAGTATFGNAISGADATVVLGWYDSTGTLHLGVATIDNTGGLKGDVVELAGVKGNVDFASLDTTNFGLN